MSHGRRRLHRLPALSLSGPIADADLLARFTAGGDEAAFELLVRRHATMVLAACRRILRNAHDADDAFQAAFLVLARKAASISRGEVLPAWLHRVACRAAFRLRANRARLNSREQNGIELLPAPAGSSVTELERVLDEEIAKLPARLRAVIVLCCLEGKSGEEAGRLLGCPPGTVSSRLTRARERLRVRLTRRGFGPAAIFAALGARPGDISAAFVPSTLIENTLRAVPAFLHGRPPGDPAAIARGVIRTMTLSQMKFAALVLAVGLLALGGVFAGARPVNEPPPATESRSAGRAKDTALPKVHVARPLRGGLDRVASYVATAEPARQVDLVAGAAGFVKNVAVDIGDRVKAGQVLVEIDAPDLALDLRQAEIVVQQAKGLLKEDEARVFIAEAEIASARGAVKQAEGQIEAAQALLDYRQKQVERLQKLFQTKAVDSGPVEEAREQQKVAKSQAAAAVTAVETARADVKVKEGRLAQAKAAVDTAKLNVQAAQLGVEKAQLGVNRSRVLAPFEGIVVRRNIAPGDSVRPDNPARRPLLTLVQVHGIRIFFAVSGRDIPQTQEGTPAEVTFDALPGVCMTGKVTRVAFAIDPKDRTMRAEIDLPNRDGKVRPGMFGRATLQLGKGPADALRVPVSAIVGLPARPGESPDAIYVYRNGQARLVRVQLSYQKGEEVEISSGLSADDLVVTNPMGLGAKPAVPVEIEDPKPAK